jgi:uncharacterized protein YndB with AHSA1/START domain
MTRHFDASPERVFDAWLDPSTAGKWLFATPSGQMMRVEIDARVGGKFLLVRRDGDDVDHVGEYLEIDRPRRLVFTFKVPKYSPDSTKVIIDIAPAGKGCDLTLTHEGVLPEWLDRTRQGWTMILDSLTRELQQGGYATLLEPGTIRFERVLPGPIERVWSYLVESDKRAKWLASGEMEPRAGSPLKFKFVHSSLSSKTAPIPEQFQSMEEGQVTEHTVTRWQPPRVLGLSWGSGKDNAPSEVIFELTPEGDKVRLVLTHRLLRDRKALLAVGPGWHSHLAVLVSRLEGREPEAFWASFTQAKREYEKRIPED